MRRSGRFVVFALVLAGSFLGSCRVRPAKELKSLNFGAIPSGSAALIYIAQDQGFFSSNGLQVQVKDYPTGVGTTEALVKGEVEIAWTAEFPLVRRALAREKISIISALSRFSDQYLFALKDHGIREVADLKGKKIGVPRNTIAEFYLARFLELNGLNAQDVVLVEVQPPQSIDSIAAGSVDGVVTWEPYTSRLKAQLSGRVLSWPVQSSQSGYGVIVCRNDWIGAHLPTLNRFLQSLARAEEYLVRYPEESKAIIRKRVSYDDAFMEIFWSENQFSLFLDQSLILAMEDEARWLIRNGLTEGKQVPDFLDFIHADGLKAVKANAVNIIH